MLKNKQKQFFLLFLVHCLIILTTCKELEKVLMVSTGDVTNILVNSATVPGEVIDEGEGSVSAKGACWSTTVNPLISNDKTTNGTGIGSFTSNLSGLLPGTTYHVRAYATNSSGTAYGKDKDFTTKTIPTVISTDPAIGAINVALNKVVNATFSQPMDPSTITISTFTINDGVTSLTGVVAYSGSTVSFTPLSNFLPSKTYTCIITKGAKNQASIPLANDFIWSFTTNAIVVPSLTTVTAASIGQTTAVSGGNINSDGGTTITSKGACWSITLNPTIGDFKTTDGTGTASFTSNLTGLLPGTTYHIRAYATNSSGTGYGNDVSFTTIPTGVTTLSTIAATSIGQTTAVSGGNINSDGGTAITSKGACWSITLNPTIGDFKTTDGTGTSSFTSNLTGLLPGTTYHIRAYATNSSGTGYGNDVSFTTNPVLIATLSTTTASSITQTTAASGGNIAADGGGAITSKGACWSTTTNPTINDSKTNEGTGTASFTSNLTGLLPGTTYHVRSYATNSAGTAYGNDVPFTTNPVVLATLSTSAVASIALTTAVSGGNITADGGGTITARGVCWSTTSNPTINDSKTIDGNGSGNFISNLSVLLQGIIYYVRAYATNSAGTAYGNEVRLSTKISDSDLNEYNTVIIGTQLWMEENLRTIKYNDNTNIPVIALNASWAALTTPALCWYNNDMATYKVPYGALYNWYAVSTGKICPTGWKVPTDADWTILTDYLIINGYGYGGSGVNIAKAMAAKSGWTTSTIAGTIGNNQSSNNSSTFSAISVGDRSAVGNFTILGLDATWWSSTPYDINNAWYRSMSYDSSRVNRNYYNIPNGFSVRCVKN